MNSNEFIPISCPFTGEEEREALKEPLETGWLAQGPKVQTFEKEFASYHEVPYALATSSCTTALHLILKAMGIGPGDEVILPAYTWVATGNVVLHCGAKPILVDILPNTYNVDPQEISKKLSPRTKAIVAVHLFGLCSEMDSILSVAGKIPVVEDAACSAGTQYKNRWAGTLGVAAAFSFHARKILTTGEGGMITTKDPSLFHQIQKLRSHGSNAIDPKKPWELPDVEEPGFNYRMTDLQASIGLVQLKKLGSMIEERKKMAFFYQENLESLSWFFLPKVPKGFDHSWQSFVGRINPQKIRLSRDQIMAFLLSKGIHTRPGTHALPALSVFKRLGYQLKDFPVTQDCYENSMALPLHNRLNLQQIQKVVSVLKECE